MSETDGWVAPGFEKVRDAFEKNFADGLEVGAAFAAYHRGVQVVDLWGGVADRTTGRPWEQDTMVLVYSTTKGVTAMCANRLADQGLLDVDAPVATYWPEFAAAGKEAVTVADLLAHRAGLAWTDTPLTYDEMLAWDPVVAALAAQAPAWAPGTAHGYHATTYGWLVGEVVRRVTGRSVGTYLREEVAGPLGAEFFIGLPADHRDRVARLVSFLETLTQGAADGSGLGDALADATGAGDLAELASYVAPGGPLFKALNAPGGSMADPGIWDDPRLWSAEIPAANGIGDARSLALLYAACVDEVKAADGSAFRIFGPGQVDRAVEPRTEGPDAVLLGLDLQWGLGFMLNRGLTAEAGMGGPRGFGHFGMGGSAGWADPDSELAMGYVMNRMTMGTTGDTRSFSLMQACVDCVR